jgi:alkylation response protein AidB-like acyl-CoA dehydrogenase
VTGSAQTDLQEVRKRATAACRSVLAACSMDGSGEAPSDAIGAALSAFADAGLFDLGFLNPEASTVEGRDMRKAAAAMEAIAAQSGWLASTYLVNLVVAGACVVIAGSPTQKSDLLPRLGSGRLQLAFALTEPDAGSDAAAPPPVWAAHRRLPGHPAHPGRDADHRDRHEAVR